MHLSLTVSGLLSLQAIPSLAAGASGTPAAPPASAGESEMIPRSVPGASLEIRGSPCAAWLEMVCRAVDGTFLNSENLLGR